MGRSRIELQAALKKLVPHVYFKRPPDNKMQYPCIVYRLSEPHILRADNKMYSYMPCYNLLYISQTPDEDMPPKILWAFDYCGFDREYESDKLYHYSFTLYY